MSAPSRRRESHFETRDMPPADTVDLVADDADDFDALEEELGEIDANAIRVNAASRWPRAGEENREEDGGGSAPLPPRRYHFGDAWDAKGDDEARGWMRRAENTLMGAARVAMHARDEISTDAARAAAADSKRDDASDADADDARTVDDACERVVRNDIRSIIGLVFAFLVFAIVAVAVRMTALRSPMRAAKQFAVARISNLPAVVRLDPERVVAMQRKYIHDIEEERVILLERLRRERTELAGVQSEARQWRNAYTRCRLEKRDLFTDRELPRIHSPMRWSPAWSFYSHPRSPWLLVALAASSSFARRYVCPCVLRGWKTFQTMITGA